MDKMSREELVRINESLFKTHIIQPTELQNIIKEYQTIAKLDEEVIKEGCVLPSLPEMLEVVNAFYNICILSKNNKVYKVF